MSDSASGPLKAFCDTLIAHGQPERLAQQHGFTAEVAQAFAVLARRDTPGNRQRTRCNPVFLDSDGAERYVAMREALAALQQDEIPAALQGRTILALNYEALMALVDTQALVRRANQIAVTYPQMSQGCVQAWRQWEQQNLAYQRLLDVLAALQGRTAPTVLFIDHLHRMLGGGWSHYPFDAAPVLKPLLNRRLIQIWGACTLIDYRIVERDPSIQHCCQYVLLPSAHLPTSTPNSRRL